MPNNPRQAIKRDLLSAINHIGKVCATLNYLAGIYNEAAPEYTERYAVAFQLAIQLAELLEAIRTET